LLSGDGTDTPDSPDGEQTNGDKGGEGEGEVTELKTPIEETIVADTVTIIEAKPWDHPEAVSNTISISNLTELLNFIWFDKTFH
jgi:hypothetical protein